MGLLTGLLTLPLAPVRGVVWVAELIRERAEHEYYDPASIRRQIEVLDRARDAGEITGQECADAQEELIARLLHRDGPHG